MRVYRVATDTEPMCHVVPDALQVRDGDRIKVGCGVEFSGNIAPSIDCRWSAGNRWESVVGSATNDTVSIDLTVLASASLDGETVQCETRFHDESNGWSRSHARRPLYRHRWSSSAVHLVAGSNHVYKVNSALHPSGVA